MVRNVSLTEATSSHVTLDEGQRVIACQPVHQASVTLWRVLRSHQRERQFREMLGLSLRMTRQLDVLRHYTVCLCQCVNFSSDATYAAATQTAAPSGHNTDTSQTVMSRIAA